MTTHAWTPTDRDRLIYRWIKFDGQKQSWVAQQLEMHQSTVSRIVERYERWIAHGGPAQQGALTRDERLRAQLWVTIERNEWIITSALRIAGEMEQHYESSKSTVHSDMEHPSQQTQMATTTAVVDRSGTACRYLRLAHLVGKNQLELLKQLDLPALEPFLLDEHEYAQALADVKPKYVNVFPDNAVPSGHRSAGVVGEGHEAEPAFNSSAPQSTVAAETLTQRASEDERPSTSYEPAPSADLASPVSASISSSPTLNLEPGTLNSSPMHILHSPDTSKSPLTPDSVVTSVQIAPHKKPFLHAYASPQNPPESTDSLAPILDATVHQPPPPIRILPLHIPLNAP